MKAALLLIAAALVFLPGRVLSQVLHPYFQQQLQNPDMVELLKAYAQNYANDASVRQLENQGVETLCECAKISLYRGGSGWNEGLQQMMMVAAYTKNLPLLAVTCRNYQALSKNCFKYQ